MVFDALIYLVTIAFAFVCLYPFYYIFINTISNNKLSESGRVIWWPKQMHIQNYIDAFRNPGLGRAAYISDSRTVIGTDCNEFGPDQ